MVLLTLDHLQGIPSACVVKERPLNSSLRSPAASQCCLYLGQVRLCCALPAGPSQALPCGLLACLLLLLLLLLHPWRLTGLSSYLAVFVPYCCLQQQHEAWEAQLLPFFVRSSELAPAFAGPDCPQSLEAAIQECPPEPLHRCWVCGRSLHYSGCTFNDMSNTHEVSPAVQELWLKLLGMGHDNRGAIVRRLLSTTFILAAFCHNQILPMCMLISSRCNQYSSCSRDHSTAISLSYDQRLEINRGLLACDTV